MQTREIQIPKQLIDEINHAKGLIEKLKEKNSESFKEAGQAFLDLEQIPDYFKAEQEIINQMIESSRKNVSKLTGQEKLFAEKSLKRIESLINNPEKYWIGKINEFELLLNRIIGD